MPFGRVPFGFFQKTPHACSFSARNSGARNGCANFVGAWHCWVLSAGEPPSPSNSSFLGGWGWKGGGTANFIFNNNGRGFFFPKWLRIQFHRKIGCRTLFGCSRAVVMNSLLSHVCAHKSERAQSFIMNRLSSFSSRSRDRIAQLPLHNSILSSHQISGSEKGVFWKRGLFRNVHFLEILENVEILENPQTLENKWEPSASEKTPFVMTPFSGPENSVWIMLCKVPLPFHISWHT